MKILVTGGAGYLGSVLVPELLEDGHKVTVIDNFMHGVPSLAHVCCHRNLEIIRGDARNMALVHRELKAADVLIPLAAIVGMPACEADRNAAVTINQYAVQHAVDLMSSDQRIVIPISNSGYGIGEPGKECDERTPMRPISLYGTTKVEAEKIAMQHDNTISLRLATVFGMSPRMRLDLLVNDFVHRAMTDRAIVLFEENFKRNYIHVRDVARAFMHALDNFDGMRNNVYNVGLSTANISKIELCRRIKKYIDFEILCAEHGSDPDKRDYIVSNAKIEATGYCPLFSLADGIEELIKGMAMLKSREYRNA